MQDSGWTGLLVAAGVSTTIGSAIPFGYNIGVINTPTALIKQWCNESLSTHDLTQAQIDFLWSTIVSSFLIGGMIGSLAGSWCADHAGRKGALIISDFLGILANVMFFACRPMHSVVTLLAARFIAGLSSGITMAVMPMYMMELSPDSVRGATAMLTTFGLTFGVLLGQFMGLDWLLGTEALWHYLLSLPLLLILASAVLLPMLPESPKYLYSIRGNKQKALKDLSRLRGAPICEVAHELEMEGEMEGGWSIGSLLAARELWLPLALVCSLQAGQQFSGINAVFYYSTSIFETAGLSQTGIQYANLGTGVINFGIAAVMVSVANRCRRRTLVLFSCSLVVATLVALTVSISYMKTISWMPKFSVFCVLFYVLVYGCGLGPIPYFIASELFDVGPRPPAMALGSAANWVGNFLIGLMFPTMQHTIGQFSFLLFAASTLAVTLFCYLKLPETFNRKQKKPRSTAEAKPLSTQVTAA